MNSLCSQYKLWDKPVAYQLLVTPDQNVSHCMLNLYFFVQLFKSLVSQCMTNGGRFQTSLPHIFACSFTCTLVNNPFVTGGQGKACWFRQHLDDGDQRGAGVVQVQGRRHRGAHHLWDHLAHCVQVQAALPHSLRHKVGRLCL